MISAENRNGQITVSLVDSLLSAIVRADGDALVMHVGERPYVVAPSGQSQLASRELTLEAMEGMLNELLPLESRQALDELGAVQHELAPVDTAGGETFKVVAAKGGDDIWIEICRRRQMAGVSEVPLEADAAPASAEDDPFFAAAHDSVPESAGPEDREPPDVRRRSPMMPPLQMAPPAADAARPPAPRRVTTDPSPRRVTPDLAAPPQSAVVLPLSRHNLRNEAVRFAQPPHAGIDRLLRIAAARRA